MKWRANVMSKRSDEVDTLWTPANKVTLLRILLIPVFVVAIVSPWPDWLNAWPDAATWKPWVAAGVFALISVTDSIDGYLARSRNEVTALGKFMDPLADKILVAAALLALIELGSLPSWPALIILAREFIVSGIRMVAASRGVVIAASWYGKAKTVLQIVAILLFIIKSSQPIASSTAFYVLSWTVMVAALILTIVSMLDYLMKAVEVMGFTAATTTEEVTSLGSGTESVFSGAVRDTGKTMDTAGGTNGSDQTIKIADSPDDSGQTVDIADNKYDRDKTTDTADSVDESDILVPACFEDQITHLAARVIRLAGNHMQLATAESCTGGLIGAALTAIPGSSASVAGGAITYSNEMKQQLLGVKAATLVEYGAVSREVACQMASGARTQMGADIAVSVTGIAGPGGAVKGKPVGTVWLALAQADGVQAYEEHFKGTRAEVRAQTVIRALQLIEAALSQ